MDGRSKWFNGDVSSSLSSFLFVYVPELIVKHESPSPLFWILNVGVKGEKQKHGWVVPHLTADMFDLGELAIAILMRTRRIVVAMRRISDFESDTQLDSIVPFSPLTLNPHTLQLKSMLLLYYEVLSRWRDAHASCFSLFALTLDTLLTYTWQTNTRNWYAMISFTNLSTLWSLRS